MKILIFHAFLFLSLPCFAQVSFEKESIKNGYKYTLVNESYCPVTVKIDGELQNMNSPIRIPKTIVMQTREKKELGKFTVRDARKKSRFSISTQTYLGNANAQHEDTYIYRLPFKSGETYTLTQGFNGKFSHQGVSALDFDLPVGSKVLSAREGIVVAVKEDSKKGCPSPDCKSLSNFIIIYHQDGSFASYGHLKKNGARVKVGDEVKKGEVIGISGNTGYSTNPHLHFELYTGGSKKTTPIKNVQFKTSKGNTNRMIEKRKYLAVD